MPEPTKKRKHAVMVWCTDEEFGAMQGACRARGTTLARAIVDTFLPAGVPTPLQRVPASEAKPTPTPAELEPPPGLASEHEPEPQPASAREPESAAAPAVVSDPTGAPVGPRANLGATTALGPRAKPRFEWPTDVATPPEDLVSPNDKLVWAFGWITGRYTALPRFHDFDRRSRPLSIASTRKYHGEISYAGKRSRWDQCCAALGMQPHRAFDRERRGKGAVRAEEERWRTILRLLIAGYDAGRAAKTA